MFTYNDFVSLHSYGTPVINKYRYVERYERFGQDNWEQNKPSGPSADVDDRDICKAFLC